MPFDFNGRRVLVAGGSRGIGRSIALALRCGRVRPSRSALAAPRPLEATRARRSPALGRSPLHAMEPCDLAERRRQIEAYVPEPP